MTDPTTVYNVRFASKPLAEEFLALGGEAATEGGFWGIWTVKMFPYNQLENGDDVLLRVSWPGGNKLAWIVSAADVLKVAYRSRSEAVTALSEWSDSDTLDNLYTDDRIRDEGGYILAFRATRHRAAGDDWDVRLQNHGWGKARPIHAAGAEEIRDLRDAFRAQPSTVDAATSDGGLVIPAGRTTDPSRLPALLTAADAPEVCAMLVTYARMVRLERLGNGWSLSCLPTWSDMGRSHVAGSLTIGTDRALTIALDKSSGRITQWDLRVAGDAADRLGDRTEEQGQRHRYLVGTSFDEFADALEEKDVITAVRHAVQDTPPADGHRATRHNRAFAAFLGLEDTLSDEVGDQDWEVAARYAWRETRERLHQGQFRKLTFASREVVECEVCGIANTTVLEAAHIRPDAEGGPSSSDNAAILCCNHHRAFDAGLLVRHDDGRYTWAPDVAPF